jgi:hypothetical protein
MRWNWREGLGAVCSDMDFFQRLFGRTGQVSALERLNQPEWKCASCEKTHHGMFDIFHITPDYWPYPRVYQPNNALRMDGDFVSEDFCVIAGTDFFVRCVFNVPVIGTEYPFGFGVWSSLSRRNFELYFEHFHETTNDDLGPWFGFFSNHVKGFEEVLGEECSVHPQAGNKRPLITLNNGRHELAIAQRDGISPEQMIEIYHKYGHEI